MEDHLLPILTAISLIFSWKIFPLSLLLSSKRYAYRERKKDETEISRVSIMNKKCEGEFLPRLLYEKLREGRRFARRFEQHVHMVHLQKGANTCHAHQPRPVVYSKQVDSKWGIIRAFVTPWH